MRSKSHDATSRWIDIRIKDTTGKHKKKKLFEAIQYRTFDRQLWVQPLLLEVALNDSVDEWQCGQGLQGLAVICLVRFADAEALIFSGADAAG